MKISRYTEPCRIKKPHSKEVKREKQTVAAVADLLIDIGDPELNLEWKLETLMRYQDLRIVLVLLVSIPVLRYLLKSQCGIP